MLIESVRSVWETFSHQAEPEQGVRSRRFSALEAGDCDADFYADEAQTFFVCENRTEPRVGIELDIFQNSVLVGFVSPGSIAERAGIQRGDCIQSVNGVKIVAPPGCGGYGPTSSVLCTASPVEEMRRALMLDPKVLRMGVSRPPVVELHGADVEFQTASGDWCPCRVSLQSDLFVRVDIGGPAERRETDFIDAREALSVVMRRDESDGPCLDLETRGGGAYTIRAPQAVAALRSLHLLLLQVSMARRQMVDQQCIGAGWLQRSAPAAPSAAGGAAGGWRPHYWCEAYGNGVVLYYDSQTRCGFGLAVGCLTLGAGTTVAATSAANPAATSSAGARLQLQTESGEGWTLALAAQLDAAQVLEAIGGCGATVA